jgi:hypothetical protein
MRKGNVMVQLSNGLRVSVDGLRLTIQRGTTEPRVEVWATLSQLIDRLDTLMGGSK